jgi:hypothetical protein
VVFQSRTRIRDGAALLADGEGYSDVIVRLAAADA